MKLLAAEALVRRFDEFVRGPETAGCAIHCVVIARGPRRLHLLQGHALLDHGLNPIAGPVQR